MGKEGADLCVNWVGVCLLSGKEESKFLRGLDWSLLSGKKGGHIFEGLCWSLFAERGKGEENLWQTKLVLFAEQEKREEIFKGTGSVCLLSNRGRAANLCVEKILSKSMRAWVEDYLLIGNKVVNFASILI